MTGATGSKHIQGSVDECGQPCSPPSSGSTSRRNSRSDRIPSKGSTRLEAFGGPFVDLKSGDMKPGDTGCRSSRPESRPGSSGGTSSMTRLPSEAVTAGNATQSAPSNASMSRPSSASASTSGLRRLPDGTTYGGSAPSAIPRRRKSTGSPGEIQGFAKLAVGTRGESASKSSLHRLSDKGTDAPTPPKGEVLQTDEAKQDTDCRSSADGVSPQPKAKAAGARGRLNKSLSVATKKEAPKKLLRTGGPPRLFTVLAEGEKIEDFFDFDKEIYCAGAKGKVVTAKRKADNGEVVIKLRTKHGNEKAWRTIMSQLNDMRKTQHVLDIDFIFEDSKHFYIIMPKCNGGALFDFLANETEIPERECKRIIREILTAVGHLHDNNLVHRDIKPENIMFTSEQSDSPSPSPRTVKLIDFDTCYSPSRPRGANTTMVDGSGNELTKARRFVGTPGYIAPEALLGDICPHSDLWSIGVIMYILMTGEMPWSSLATIEDGIVGSPGAMKMYNNLKEEVIDWCRNPWPEFPEACDLCKQLLAFDVSDRLDVKQALAHCWLTS